MRLISPRAWALVVVSSGLQILIFPTGGPMPGWRAALCWVALVPMLLALRLPGKDRLHLSVRNSIVLGYFCGMVWFFGNCFWIYQTMFIYGGLPKFVSMTIVILFSLYLGFYHALFAGLFSWMGQRYNLALQLVLVPFLWVAVELARSRVTGFPWDLLGNSQVDNLFLTRVAPIAGVMGMSFAIAGVNAGFAFVSYKTLRLRWVVPACALLVALTLQLAGVGARPASVASQTAVLLEENLEVGAVGKAGSHDSVGDELEAFTRASLHPQVEEGASYIRQDGRGLGKPALIVWPEAPSHFQSNDPMFRAEVGELAREVGAPVIAGSLGVDMDAAAGRGYFLYDSASLFGEAGSYQGRYDKIHLVPWGEYIPFKRFFSFAQKLTEGVGDMDAGRERTVFHAGGHSYGVFVCYESIFGDEVREFAKNGAEVLVNISDDGWYGETGAPWQHLNMARMRAIENNRWVLRATNTGVTTAIDPLGRVSEEAPRHVRGAFAFGFDYVQGTTFYTRHGDWFAYLCALVTVVLCGLGWMRRGSARMV